MSSLGLVVRNPETDIHSGTLNLLGFRDPLGVEIVPNTAKRSSDQPDYRILHGVHDLGAGWIKTGRESGAPYVSLRIFHPQIGRFPIHAKLGRAAGQDDEDVLAVIAN